MYPAEQRIQVIDIVEDAELVGLVAALRDLDRMDYVQDILHYLHGYPYDLDPSTVERLLAEARAHAGQETMEERENRESEEAKEWRKAEKPPLSPWLWDQIVESHEKGTPLGAMKGLRAMMADEGRIDLSEADVEAMTDIDVIDAVLRLYRRA